MHVHVGLVRKHIEVALRHHLQSERQFLRLRFTLPLQFGVQIHQRRRLDGVVARKIFAVNAGQAAVDDGLIHGTQLTRTAHELLEERQHEFTLCNQRVFAVAVPQRQIERIDVVK